MRRGRVDNDMRISMMKLQVHSRVDRGVLHLSHLLVGHEILREGLFLERLEPCEVRLVVRKYAAHQLNVGPILIRQVPVPGLSEIAAAPGPLLFARGHMMIRDMQKARLDAVVVSAHEVIGRALRHIAGRHRDILISGNVHAFAVVMLVINAPRDREPGHIPLAVVHDKMHIRREDGLGIVIYRNRRVRPPEECLRKVCPVVELPPDLNVCPVRIQGKGGDSLGAVHLVNVIARKRLASVLML